MRTQALLLALCVLAARAGAQAAIPVSVDPRMELVSIVFRLAGNPEYSMGRVPSYNADFDRWFSPFKEHAAVKRARTLRATRGMGFDGPMSLTVYLTDADEPKERVPLEPLPEGVDSRWTPADARAFIADLRAFAHDTRFGEFIRAHRPLYDGASAALGKLLADARVEEWFRGFFGPRNGASFHLALGMTNGGGSYGCHAKLPDGSEEIYSILGVWQTDATGAPAFDPGVVSTIVHEFAHSHTNPIVERHYAELKRAGEKIYPYVAAEMRPQAYSGWQTMMCESLVRACEVRFAEDRSGAQEAAKIVAYNRGRGFLWTGELAALLGEYDAHRADYSSFDAFFPRVVAFFDAYSGRIEKVIAERKAEQARRMAELRAKGPKVVKCVPPNGAMKADPSLKAIVVTFDRPMAVGNLAVMFLADAPFPETTGRAHFDASGTVLTIPVHLKPAAAYGFGLNSETMLAMRDTAGNPLGPVRVYFRTR